jgi:GH24 family phage-related lysozyme (muramidase)
MSKEQIKKWFETKYITGGAKVLPDLIKRRKEESNLFFK